jgi:hypothetical protein
MPTITLTLRRPSTTPPCLRALLAEFEAATRPNPMSRDERLLAREDANWSQGAGVVTVGLSVFDGRLRLDGIRALAVGRGDGTWALTWLCALADRHGATIMGSATPFGRSPGGLAVRPLAVWYRKHGFHVDPDGTMHRPPQGEVRNAIAPAAAPGPSPRSRTSRRR